MRKQSKLYHTKSGDRTLTSAQKRNLKEERGFKCDVCHKKFNPRYLEIHHKKSIASHKQVGDLGVYQWGNKYKPKYDRQKSNLQVVCIMCHDKTKKKKRKAKKNLLFEGLKGFGV